MKKKIEIIKSIDINHMLARDYSNNSILILKSHLDKFDYTKQEWKNNNKYHANIVINENRYEALELFPPYNKDVAFAILTSVYEIGEPINISVNKIMSMLKEFNDRISLDVIRGAFGEIYAMKELKIKQNGTSNSIYDFVNENGEDVEIKTFSKVERKINLSYQQLTNNPDAIVYSFELYESSKGLSLLELFDSIYDKKSSDFDWIKMTSSNLVNLKFEIGEMIINKMKHYSSGLSMPTKAIDARFKFTV